VWRLPIENVPPSSLTVLPVVSSSNAPSSVVVAGGSDVAVEGGGPSAAMANATSPHVTPQKAKVPKKPRQMPRCVDRIEASGMTSKPPCLLTTSVC
jgi:hypothetical protein